MPDRPLYFIEAVIACEYLHLTICDDDQENLGQLSSEAPGVCVYSEDGATFIGKLRWPTPTAPASVDPELEAYIREKSEERDKHHDPFPEGQSWTAYVSVMPQASDSQQVQ